MNGIGDAIREFFNSAANQWMSYVMALTIIGGVTMALLQTIKDLFPVRQWFQKYRLQQWMEEGAAEARANFGNNDITADKAEAELLMLAVDGDANALYDLQIEQLCGQYTAAIQMVLEFPAMYVNLLAVTASKASSADVNEILKPPASPAPAAFVDARNRVTHQCQRAIDAFQISTGFRWKWYLQFASIAVSIVLAWVALHYQATKVADNGFSILVTAILAGFLAPVGKDLLAVLQKARGQ